MITFYGYKNCSTCQKAKKFLEKRHVSFKEIDITQTPPSAAVLKKALATGAYELKHLFNTSGQLYRQLNMKERAGEMNESEILHLLSTTGKLVKRPIITDGRNYTVGFKEEEFKKIWE